MNIAFYKGRKRLRDRAICASSSFMDGGVRIKHMDLAPAHWDVIEVGGTTEAAWEWLYAHHGQGYDVLGLVGFVARVLGHDKARWVCSEAVAAMLGVPDAWRFDPCSLHAALSRAVLVDKTTAEGAHA